MAWFFIQIIKKSFLFFFLKIFKRSINKPRLFLSNISSCNIFQLFRTFILLLFLFLRFYIQINWTLALWIGIYVPIINFQNSWELSAVERSLSNIAIHCIVFILYVLLMCYKRYFKEIIISLNWKCTVSIIRVEMYSSNVKSDI